MQPPLTIVQRASDPVEQHHRLRIVRAVMREDHEETREALSDITDARVLSSMTFIVERLRSPDLMSFVEERMKVLMNERVESQ